MLIEGRNRDRRLLCSSCRFDSGSRYSAKSWVDQVNEVVKELKCDSCSFNPNGNHCDKMRIDLESNPAKRYHSQQCGE
jgi:hypothetical protein